MYWWTYRKKIFGPIQTFNDLFQRKNRLDILAAEGEEPLQPSRLSQSCEVWLDQKCETKILFRTSTLIRWLVNIFALNLGKPRNGADSFDTLEYLNALARTEQDLPALVFYSLIGKLKSTSSTVLCSMALQILTGKDDLFEEMMFVEWPPATWQLQHSSGRMCSMWDCTRTENIEILKSPKAENL